MQNYLMFYYYIALPKCYCVQKSRFTLLLNVFAHFLVPSFYLFIRSTTTVTVYLHFFHVECVRTLFSTDIVITYQLTSGALRTGHPI